MAEPIRVGIVGTSGWAQMVHLPSLHSHPGARLSAICGRNRTRAEELAKKYGIPQVLTDYRQMIEQGQLDALVVVVPDDLHYPVTMEALHAGLHVLCEKPLARTATQARTMYETAEAVGVKHMTFFSYRFMPYWRYMRALIDAGYIGQWYDAQFLQLTGYARGPLYRWQQDPQRSHGALSNIGSHLIDLARWYVGDVASVQALLTSNLNRQGPDGQPFDGANDTALLTLQFSNGAQATIHVSTMAYTGMRGMLQQTRLHGAAGSLELEWHMSGYHHIRGLREPEQAFSTLPVPDDMWTGVQPGDIFGLTQVQPVADRQFIDAILEDRPITPSFYEGWKAQEVVDAAIESDRQRCRIAVP